MTVATGQAATQDPDPAPTPDRVADEVLRFLETKTKVRWEVDQDLFESGVVSSMFAMELVVYLEKTFGVTVLGADLQLANFRTVRAMANLVARLRGDRTHGD
jgi:methoxymalonate biosynthesis acyl carrier protein